MTPSTGFAHISADGDDEAQEAAKELAKQLIDPVLIYSIFKKLNITTEWMVSVLKQIALNSEASDSGRIAAIRELRGIMRDAGLSSRELNKHFKLEEAVADTLRKKMIDARPGSSEPAHIREARKMLDMPFRMNGD
jgi:hypothetical protein